MSRMQAAQKLCVLLAGCMAHVISEGLAALPLPLTPAEALPRPSLLAGAALQQPTSEQCTHPAPAAGHNLANGSASMHPAEAPPSTPNKAPPALAGAGPEQMSQHAVQATPGRQVRSILYLLCSPAVA